MTPPAAALSIVATAVGGMPDVVADGHNGLLLPPADAATLARAVVEVFGDPVRRHGMSAAARRRAEERFDARVVATQVLRLCNEVCEPAREQARPRGRRRPVGVALHKGTANAR